jgi:hypothetical protein
MDKLSPQCAKCRIINISLLKIYCKITDNLLLSILSFFISKIFKFLINRFIVLPISLFTLQFRVLTNNINNLWIKND